MHQKGPPAGEAGNIALIPLIIIILVVAGVVFFLIFKGVIKNPLQSSSSNSNYCKSNPKDSACAQYAGQYGGGGGGGQQPQQQQQSQPQVAPPTVQGVNTTRSFFQLILDTLFRR